MSLVQGLAVERQAKMFLIKQGMDFVLSNYRSRWGEIDLIMREKEYFVFVEVRSRVSEAYGGAIDSITLGKQKKIRKTALYYMTVNKLLNRHPARFDVLVMQGRDQEFDWIKNAFC